LHGNHKEDNQPHDTGGGKNKLFTALVVIYSIQSEVFVDLLSHLKTATFQGSEQLIFTPASIVGLIVFFMIAMQCMSTMAIAKREMGSLKASLAMTGFYIGLAYVLAVITVQGLRFLGIA
jgi:Fe2+ transport system protein B